MAVVPRLDAPSAGKLRFRDRTEPDFVIPAFLTDATTPGCPEVFLHTGHITRHWLMHHALALDAVLPPEVRWHEPKSDPAPSSRRCRRFGGSLPPVQCRRIGLATSTCRSSSNVWRASRETMRWVCAKQNSAFSLAAFPVPHCVGEPRDLRLQRRDIHGAEPAHRTRFRDKLEGGGFSGALKGLCAA